MRVRAKVCPGGGPTPRHAQGRFPMGQVLACRSPDGNLGRKYHKIQMWPLAKKGISQMRLKTSPAKKMIDKCDSLTKPSKDTVGLPGWPHMQPTKGQHLGHSRRTVAGPRARFPAGNKAAAPTWGRDACALGQGMLGKAAEGQSLPPERDP